MERHFSLRRAVCVAVAGVALSQTWADKVELMNEKVIEGKVTGRTAESVSILLPSGAGTAEATVPMADIHALTVHKDNPEVLQRTFGALANVYERLLQDWARASFWHEKFLRGDADNINVRVRLAECYWRLGSRPMAVEEVKKAQGYVTPGMVKLWSDMGELETALALAEKASSFGAGNEMIWLAAGDGCRQHGDFKRALTCYDKVVRSPANDKRVKLTKDRARDNLDAVKAFNLLDLRRVPDGTYSGSSLSYTGPLEVSVAVRQGRIQAVRVTKHTDKQYLGSLAEMPRQIVARQSLVGIDAVTGATVTSDAIVNATARALAKATEPPAQ